MPDLSPAQFFIGSASLVSLVGFFVLVFQDNYNKRLRQENISESLKDLASDIAADMKKTEGHLDKVEELFNSKIECYEEDLKQFNEYKKKVDALVAKAGFKL